MKNIEILGTPDIYLLKTWLLPAFFGFLLMLDFIISGKFNVSIAFSFFVWSLIVLSIRQGFTGKIRKSQYILEFGKQDLICKFKTSILWHIPYSKISHAVKEEVSSETIFFPKREQFLIYTKDGDSYSIPIEMPSSQVLEITSEIERVADAYKRSSTAPA